MWESLRIEIPRKGCASLPMVKLIFYGSFLAIRTKIHQNFSSSMTPSEAGGYAQISDCYVICGIFATITVLIWVPCFI